MTGLLLKKSYQHPCKYHKNKYKKSQSTDVFYVNSVNTLTKFIHSTILTDKLEFLVILKVQRSLPLRIVFSIRTSNWLSVSSCERINKMLYRFFSIIHSNHLFVVFIHVLLLWGMPLSMKVSDDCLSGFIELLLPLPASRALPVFRQVLEGHAVVRGRVIHVAADGADVLARSLLLREVHLVEYSRNRVV